MFRTEVNLLNTICKTEFFLSLALRTDKLTDYSLILDEYCLFVRYQQEGVLLNEPRQITYKSSPHIFASEYLAPTQFFTSSQLSKINQTIQISNILIQPFTASNTYQLIKDLDNDLVSSLFFFQDSYSFLDVIVFSSLQKCRIWPKLYKESRKSKKELPLLIDWFKVFMNTYKHQIEYQFHPSIVAEKYQKKLEQQTKERRQDKELIEAVRTANYAEITKLVDSGSDIESIESRMYMRAAHIACELGNIDLCIFLDKLNCDWSSLDKELQTPIYYAVNSNNLEIVKFLVEEKHVDHQHKEFQNRTPFYLACFLGNLPMIEYLYSKGVNVNEPSKLKRCALSKACYLGHLDVVQFLVNCPGIDLVLQDSKGRTAMHNAAWGIKGGKEGKKRGTIMLPDSPESIKILHDHGHPIDILDLEGNSALMSAASSDAQDSLKLLIQRGANKHIQNIYKENSVFLAAKFGHLEMIKLLVEVYNVEWWLRDNSDTSALEIAGIQLHFDCMEYLLNLEIKDKRYLNPEHFLDKIQDDYLKETDQVAVFKKYASKVDISKGICDLIFLGNFIEKCKNLELLMAVINTVIDKLSSEQMQSLIDSILKDTSRIIGQAQNTNGRNNFSIHPMLANNQIFDDNSQNQELVYQRPMVQQGQQQQQQQQQMQSRKLQTVLMIYQMYEKVNKEKVKQIVLDYKLVFDELLNVNSQSLTEEELKVLLFECNLDWIHYTDKMTGNTFLHLLCQKRSTKAITLFLKLITDTNRQIKSANQSEFGEGQDKNQQNPLQLPSDTKLAFTTTNKFLLSTDLSNLSFIRSYFESLNFEGLHVLDVCILSRFNDLHLILQVFLGNLLSSAPTSHYSIPQYTLTPSTQLTNPIHSQRQQLTDEGLALGEMIKEKNASKLNALRFFSFDKEFQVEEEKSGQMKIIGQRTAIIIDNLNSDKDKLMVRQLLAEIESQSVFGVDLEYYQPEAEEITGNRSANNPTMNSITANTSENSENNNNNNNAIIPNSTISSAPQTANPSSGQLPAQKIFGFVCTMQISTSSNDYILDCITLRDSIFDLLGVSLFMNYAKIKVMHGCDTDLKWLKQDFNIDVVSLFDTSKAHMLIHNLPVSHSLKNVVQQNLSIDLDKSYQLADWRIRPLPSQMIVYAQMDSRILLEVFYCQVKQLAERQLLPQMQLASIRLVLKHTEPFYQNTLTLVEDKQELQGQYQLQRELNREKEDQQVDIK